MSQAGRYLETDKVAMGVWKRLTDTFSVASLMGTAVLSFRSTFPYHKDNLGLMLKTPRWKIGLGLLGGLSDLQIDFLEQYAAINSGRVDHVFRAFALALVSIPISALVALNELVPGVFQAEEFSFLGAFMITIFVWALFASIMFASAWRARDLHDLIRFEQARRQHANNLDAAEAAE